MFFKESIKSLKTTGSFKPSSKSLINECLKDISFKENQLIVEFGSGNGCITEEILNKLHHSSKLISFEINPVFFKFCKEKFSYKENFKIINESAIEFDKVIEDLETKKIDYIVSSLPFSLLKNEDINILIEKILLNLNNNGRYTQYQYSLGKYRFLKKKFKRVHLKFIFKNTPPSFIYHCYI